jgi:hypothetical protein
MWRAGRKQTNREAAMRSLRGLGVVLTCFATFAGCGNAGTSERASTNKSAIVDGVSTADRVGNVGTIFFKFSAADETWYWYGGTGTLAKGNVFVTAAHTFFQFQQPGLVFGVTFVPSLDETDVPYQRTLPPGAKVYTGMAHVDPLYDPAYVDPSTGLPSPHDLAVIVLDERPHGIEPARLAPIGYVDSVRHGPPSLHVGIAGYGSDFVLPFEGNGTADDVSWGVRRFSTMTLAALLGTLLDPEPGLPCVMDSGGPAFPTIATVDGPVPPPRFVPMVAALAIGMTDIAANDAGLLGCSGQSLHLRLDTQSAHAFLDPYVGNP